MTLHRLLFSAAALLPLLACDARQPGEPARSLTASQSSSNGVGEHGGGPPSSLVFYSRRQGGLAKIFTMNADGSGVEQVSFGPGNDLWPDISTNGRYVAFASNRSGNNEIYVLDLRDGSLTNVSNDAGDDNWPRWSPNGQQIAFHSNRDGDYNIYVVNADGTGMHRVTSDPALDQWPDWSPDGKRIAFRRAFDIYTADADGEEQNVQRLTFLPTTIDQMPAWSPDGQQIAFMSLREGYCAVFLMNADGSDQTNLTPKTDKAANSAWCSRAPSWSRNGQEIYFMSVRPSTGGDAELFALRVGETVPRNISNSPGEDGGPRAR